jgi:hypothetical protein
MGAHTIPVPVPEGTERIGTCLGRRIRPAGAGREQGTHRDSTRMNPFSEPRTGNRTIAGPSFTGKRGATVAGPNDTCPRHAAAHAQGDRSAVSFVTLSLFPSRNGSGSGRAKKGLLMCKSTISLMRGR